MKRTAASCGIAAVDRISNTKDRSRTTSDHSEKGILRVLVFMVFMRTIRRNALLVLRMNEYVPIKTSKSTFNLIFFKEQFFFYNSGSDLCTPNWMFYHFSTLAEWSA